MQKNIDFGNLLLVLWVHCGCKGRHFHCIPHSTLYPHMHDSLIPCRFVLPVMRDTSKEYSEKHQNLSIVFIG